MAEIKGLIGLRPLEEKVNSVTCPPYDVIKPGSALESVLSENKDSLFHITLGENPVGAFESLINNGSLKNDSELCFYIYEQEFAGEKRIGVLTATQVTDYKEGHIIRHEKTFDDKVKGRLALRAKTGYTLEPVFLLTKSSLKDVFAEIMEKYLPIYSFTSDFKGASELHGIKNRIYRVPEDSQQGQIIKDRIKENPLYIADGHHRYHAALLNKQTHCLAYICPAEDTKIQAYNRVINGLISFNACKEELELVEVDEFKTPAKHEFSIYTKEGIYTLKAKNVPDDVIGRLDCSVLEKELYPQLKLTHDMIMDSRHFDYYAEAELDKMMECVDTGKYDIAVALHPVSVSELLAVADAGVDNSEIVMPEKSTFFAPKILSGLFIYKHKII